MILIKYLYYC